MISRFSRAAGAFGLLIATGGLIQGCASLPTTPTASMAAPAATPSPPRPAVSPAAAAPAASAPETRSPAPTQASAPAAAVPARPAAAARAATPAASAGARSGRAAATPVVAADPKRAAQLRASGLEQLNRGNINSAVSLLQQANALDPSNALIKGDLDRALRVSQAVAAKAPVKTAP